MCVRRARSRGGKEARRISRARARARRNLYALIVRNKGRGRPVVVIAREAERKFRSFTRQRTTVRLLHHRGRLLASASYLRETHQHVGGKARKTTEIMSSRLALPVSGPEHKDFTIHSGGGEGFRVACTSTLTWQK